MVPSNSPTDGRPQPAVIGIDFGSSKCCVAAVRDGRVLVLENEFGQRTTPSCVAFNSQQRLVGGAALDQAIVNCTNTVHAVKRTLGRTYEELQACFSDDESASTSFERIFSFPQGCASVDGRAGINVHYRDDKMVLFPEEIAAALLSKMKSIAETKLGCPVEGAAVSVPAYFNNQQRKAMKIAAEIAGLGKVSLINEPTAAATDYASISNFNKNETIFVVDFGAGKLDVSLVSLSRGVVHLKSTSGDLNIGGYDLDMLLLEMSVKYFMNLHHEDLWQDQKALARLRAACQKAKHNLSSLREVRIEVEDVLPGRDFKMAVTRQKFQDLYLSKLEREIRRHITLCCVGADVHMDSVDKILIVGGSTRLPGVQNVLKTIFGKNLTKTVNLDETVAAGAALVAMNSFGNCDNWCLAAAGVSLQLVSRCSWCLAAAPVQFFLQWIHCSTKSSETPAAARHQLQRDTSCSETPAAARQQLQRDTSCSETPAAARQQLQRDNSSSETRYT
ncbi:Heat shock protein 70 family [Trinorchestia longiramus]|nr:Heat shock protein 70 family [Trinorchestia longiramus]